jgi:hypothetical protein
MIRVKEVAAVVSHGLVHKNNEDECIMKRRAVKCVK